MWFLGSELPVEGVCLCSCLRAALTARLSGGLYSRVRAVLTPGLVRFLGAGLPADLLEGVVHAEEAVVLPRVRAHLDQLASRLHEVQTVRS